jgi:hypothetical protein
MPTDAAIVSPILRADPVLGGVSERSDNICLLVNRQITLPKFLIKPTNIY